MGLRTSWFCLKTLFDFRGTLWCWSVRDLQAFLKKGIKMGHDKKSMAETLVAYLEKGGLTHPCINDKSREVVSRPQEFKRTN